jgi:hypothetical protein
MSEAKKSMKNDSTSVELSLFINIKFRDEIIAELLSILYSQGEDYAPEKVDYGNGWRSLNYNNLSPLMKNWSKANNILFTRESKYKSDLAILISSPPSSLTIISFWVEESFFHDNLNIQRYLETSKLLYDLFSPQYGFIHQTEDKLKMATIQDPRYGKTILPININRGLPGIYWANFLGQNFVEKLGRSRLLSAPCYKVEELTDGGLLFLTGHSPLVVINPEMTMMRKKLELYIGKQFFYP